MPWPCIGIVVEWQVPIVSDSQLDYLWSRHRGCNVKKGDLVFKNALHVSGINPLFGPSQGSGALWRLYICIYMVSLGTQQLELSLFLGNPSPRWSLREMRHGAAPEVQARSLSPVTQLSGSVTNSSLPQSARFSALALIPSAFRNKHTSHCHLNDLEVINPEPMLIHRQYVRPSFGSDPLHAFGYFRVTNRVWV